MTPGGYTLDVPNVRNLRAAWLTRLPAPCTLLCRAPDVLGDTRKFIVTTSLDVFQRAERAPCPVLHGQQWLGLVRAAHECAASLAVSQWLLPGLPFGDLPSWVIRGSIYDLLGGQWGPATRLSDAEGRSLRATVGDVLEHFGAELVAVDPHDLPRDEGQL